MRIRVDDLASPQVQALVRLHLAGLNDLSPPDSMHAYGLERLRDPGVTVWSAWEGEELLGIGALQAEPGGTEGEIKSMRTDPRHLGQGVGRAILRHIVGHATSRGLTRLMLETGTGEAFVPAHRLYLSEGFVPCGPFGPYTHDPHSRFFSRELNVPGDQGTG